MVYSSIFTDSSRAYFHAIDCMIEEEKMAVILQEVVGNEYNGKYYPNISGVAQSYNFYPFSYIKPEDGFAVIAMIGIVFASCRSRDLIVFVAVSPSITGIMTSIKITSYVPDSQASKC